MGIKKVTNTIIKEAKQNTRNVTNFNNMMMMLGDVKEQQQSDHEQEEQQDNDTNMTSNDNTTTTTISTNTNEEEEEEKRKSQDIGDEKKSLKRVKRVVQPTTNNNNNDENNNEIKELKRELEMVREELESREAELKLQEKSLRKAKKEAKDAQQKVQSTQFKLNKSATRSVAIPSDILDDVTSEEMKTYLTEMIARVMTLFAIDEIVVYKSTKSSNATTDKLLKLLEFIDLPKNIRHHLYDMDDVDYQFVDKLKRPDVDSHTTTNRWTKYREGITTDQCHGKFSLVDVGLGDDKWIKVDKEIQAGVRVTLEMEEEIAGQKHNPNQPRKGRIVSPADVRKDGRYWGYQVRYCDSIQQVTSNSPFNTYDYRVLLSPTVAGATPFDKTTFDNDLESYNHILIVFAEREQDVSMFGDDAKSIETPDQPLFNKRIDIYTGALHAKRVRFEETLPIGLSLLTNKLI